MEDWYYKVYTDKDSCMFYRRDDAYEFYKRNNGCKIEIITKDLYPNVQVIIDEQGFNLERIRKDFTLKQTSEALRKAISRYDKSNTKQLAIKLNKNTDKDILDYLETIPNKQGFIKELIRKEMLRDKKL